MSPQLEALRRQRAKLVAERDACLEAPTRENRDLTNSEASKFDSCRGRIAKIDLEIIDAEEVVSRQRNVDQLHAYLGQGGGEAARKRPLALTRSQSLREHPALARHTNNEGLSFDKMLRGIVTGEWDCADLEKRAVGENPLSSGGFMVPTPIALEVIDLARNASRVMQAGASTVPMTSATLVYPRLISQTSPAWRAEGGPINDATMTFDAVTLTARTLAILVKISLELFEDATTAATNVIEHAFARSLAVELDRVALRGSGTAPEPRGVLNQTGVTTTSHGANGLSLGTPAGTAPAYDPLLDAVQTVRSGNFEPNAQIIAPRTETSLAKSRDTQGRYIAPPMALENIVRLTTNQVPTNLTVGTNVDNSEIYTGQWDQLLWGLRTDLQIRFLNQRYLDNGQYAFLAYLRGDIALAHPAAFNVDVGIRA